MPDRVERCFNNADGVGIVFLYGFMNNYTKL